MREFVDLSWILLSPSETFRSLDKISGFAWEHHVPQYVRVNKRPIPIWIFLYALLNKTVCLFWICFFFIFDWTKIFSSAYMLEEHMAQFRVRFGHKEMKLCSHSSKSDATVFTLLHHIFPFLRVPSYISLVNASYVSKQLIPHSKSWIQIQSYPALHPPISFTLFLNFIEALQNFSFVAKVIIQVCFIYLIISVGSEWRAL